MNNVITVREYALRLLHIALQDDPYTQAIMLSGGSALDTMAERILALYGREDFSALTPEQCTYWEMLMGITSTETDLDVRRSIIRAKWMGTQPPTLAGIQAVANAWADGEISVTYRSEDQTVELSFSSQRGIPKGEDKLRSAIREFVPAHVACVYAYLYLTCAECNAMTCAEMNATPLKMFAGRGY